MSFGEDRRLVTFKTEAEFLPCGVEQEHIGDIFY